MSYEKYKLKNGSVRWHVHAYIGTDERTGKAKYFDHRSYLTKADAKSALELATADFKRGKDISTRSTSPTLQAVYDEWRPMHAQDVRKQTDELINSIWRYHVKPDFGSYYVDKITAADLQKWLYRQAKLVSNVRGVKSVMHQLLKYAVRMGYIKYSPLDATDMPRIRKPSQHIQHNWLELDELSKFVSTAVDCAHIDPTPTQNTRRAITCLLLIAATGCRSGEARGLRWSDIELDTGTIRIQRSAVIVDGVSSLGPTKNASSVRTAQISGTALSLLREWRTIQPSIDGIRPDALVFPQATTPDIPMWPEYLATRLRWLLKRAGVRRVTPHGLRHTKATLIAQSGISATSIAAVLGHASTLTTQRVYIHPTQSGQSEAESEYRKLTDL